MKFYSIRVVRAKNKEEAIEKVISGEFDERDPVCDIVIPAKEVVIKCPSMSSRK